MHRFNFFLQCAKCSPFSDADINNQKYTAALNVPGPRVGLGNRNNKKVQIMEDVFILTIGGRVKASGVAVLSKGKCMHRLSCN